MAETNLILGFAGMPPQSARNCMQELSPIPNGEFRKTINGNLLFLQAVERKKYKSTIICKDVNSPIADGMWVGSQILVGCIQNLWQAIEPGNLNADLIRPAVAGSVYAVNNFGEKIKFKSRDNAVELYKKCEERVFICFRPWLTMQITDFAIETDEWGTNSGWKLQLEEI